MKETLSRLLENCDIKHPIVEISKLHGDASYRIYYRARLGNDSSIIIMQMPVGKSSASEEITNTNVNLTELPFINIAKFLKTRGINVPSIIVYNEETKLLLLEDLGDGLLYSKVSDSDNDIKLLWYKKAVDLLLQLQEKTAKKDPSCIAFERSFDQTLLNWEFDHFLEYVIEARLGKKMIGADLDIFKKSTREITNRIQTFPYTFTHRDFQSRNIIAHEGNLYLIDFQDALMGPGIYDLVSLTRDSYVVLTDAVRDELICQYAEKTGRPLRDIQIEYNTVTIHRKLKDAGRFVYIDKVKKNPNYLKFITTSLIYAKVAFEKMPEYNKLFEVLKKYVPELR